MYSEGSGNGSILAKSKARALLCRTMCVSYIRIHKYSLNITEKKYCYGKKFFECFLVIFREYVVIIFLWFVFYLVFVTITGEGGSQWDLHHGSLKSALLYLHHSRRPLVSVSGGSCGHASQKQNNSKDYLDHHHELLFSLLLLLQIFLCFFFPSSQKEKDKL